MPLPTVRFLVERPALLVVVLMSSLAARAAVPPEAQPLVTQGVAAARNQDFVQAARLFAEARKLAPDAPEILFNLGLAESKIPGRELRAVSWLSAYLLSADKPANAAAVRSQIEVLMVNARTNRARLVASLRAAAEKFPDPRSDDRGRAMADVGRVLMRSGDPAGAQQLVDGMLKNDNRDSAQQTLVDEMAAAGNFDAAIWATEHKLDQGPNPQRRDDSWRVITTAVAKTGDVVRALKLAEKIAAPHKKCETLVSIATVQFDRGDKAGGLRTLETAIRTLGMEPSETSKPDQWHLIARAYANAGEINRAFKILEQIKSDFYFSRASRDIAVAQARAGDLTGSHATLDRIPDRFRSMMRYEIERGERQAPTGVGIKPGPATSVEWIQLCEGMLTTPIFLDLATHLKTLPAENARSLFDNLNTTMSRILEAQQLVEELLRRMPATPASNDTAGPKS